jgi:hypothetical protein
MLEKSKELLRRFKTDNLLYQRHFLYQKQDLADVLEANYLAVRGFMALGAHQPSVEDELHEYKCWLQSSLKQAGSLMLPDDSALELLMSDENKQSKVRRALEEMPPEKAKSPVKRLKQYRPISALSKNSKTSKTSM